MAQQNSTERAERHTEQTVLDRVVPKILLNYEEAAWSLGISKKGLYNLVSRERIPTVKVGGKVCFSPRDLEDFADAHRSG
jgi:excisionase family DNA binding protein